MDILFAVFGRALYFRFKCLYDEASKTLIGDEELRWKHSREGICDGMFSPNSMLIDILKFIAN